MFYNRVKGEVEKGIESLGYPSFTIVRPSLLDGGPRPDSRPGERLGLWLAKALKPLIPLRYRAISTGAVAKTLLESALAAKPGVYIVESDALQRL